MGIVKTVTVVDSRGNKVVVNEEDAGQYKKAEPQRATPKPGKRKLRNAGLST